MREGFDAPMSEEEVEEVRGSREPFLWNAREEGVVLHGRIDEEPPPEAGREEHA